jgi:hypothetical protein
LQSLPPLFILVSDAHVALGHQSILALNGYIAQASYPSRYDALRVRRIACLDITATNETQTPFFMLSTAVSILLSIFVSLLLYDIMHLFPMPNTDCCYWSPFYSSLLTVCLNVVK